MDARPLVGKAGEDAAAAHYTGRGYLVIARNWRCRIGELDLIAVRGDTLVVCEVKTRRGSSFGAGYEAVDARKRAKLRSVAEAFLQTDPRLPSGVRFDVASVALARDGSASVHVFEDAF
jgi:putative endonuclease